MSRISQVVSIPTLFSRAGESAGVYRPLEYFQRTYEWTDKEIDTLFADIEESYNSPERTLDIGDIKLVNDKDNLAEAIIVDGLQRMTTVMLMLSAFRDYFLTAEKNEKDIETHSKIRETRKNLEKYIYVDEGSSGLSSKDIELSKRKCRLQQALSNNKIFKLLVDNYGYSPDMVDTMAKQRLVAAKQFAANWVASLDECGGIDNVYNYADFITNSGGLTVCREVDTSSDSAVKRFISINSRGKPLSPEEMIKNLFLNVAPLDKNDIDDDEEYYRSVCDAWVDFTSNLEIKKVKGKSSIDSEVATLIKPLDLLRYYIISTGTRVYTQDIYKHFDDKVKNGISRREMLHIVDDIKTASLRSRELMLGTYKISNEHVNNLIGLSGNRNQGQRQVWPVLISMTMSDLTSVDYDAMAVLLERFSFMVILLGNNYDIVQTNTSISKSLMNKSKPYEERVAEAIDVLKQKMSEWRSDFLNSLMNYRFPDKGSKKVSTQYVLYTLSDALGSQCDGWTIEHILPMLRGTPTTEEYKKLVCSLGNLALIQSPDNSSIGKKLFNEKRLIYEHVECRLTSSIATPIVTNTKDTMYDKAIKVFNYVPTIGDEWGEAEICARGEAMKRLVDYTFFGTIQSP